MIIIQKNDMMATFYTTKKW